MYGLPRYSVAGLPLPGIAAFGTLEGVALGAAKACLNRSGAVRRQNGQASFRGTKRAFPKYQGSIPGVPLRIRGSHIRKRGRARLHPH